MDHSLFYQLTGVLLIAGLIAVLISALKQPSILAFILTGILVGYFGSTQLHATAVFSDLGEIGITLLLFMVGLELDVGRLKELGKVVFVTAIGQICGSSILGFILARLFGFDITASVYIALALTFTSTIIVVKLLSEKGQLQSLHGRIAVGCSIIQDFVALALLVFLGNSSGSSIIPSSLDGWQVAVITLVRVLILFLLLLFASKKVLPWVLKFFSKNDELLLSFSLAWALGMAAFASLPLVGFNFEIGGFLAGLALANSQAHWEIAARVKSIRDFFIIIFFIVFGSQLAFGNVWVHWPQVAVFSLFMLVVNPFLILLLLSLQGYKTKTSFLAASMVVPMSEFSFILAAFGSRSGQITQGTASLITLVGLVSIAFSSYVITHAERLYILWKPFLKYFDRKGGAAETASQTVLKNHIILAGAHRLGRHLIATLEKSKSGLVIVDINPDVTAEYAAMGLTVVCGDITEAYIQDQVNLASAKIIISTVPDFHDNLALLEAVKRKTAGRRIKPKLIFAAQTEAEAKKLYEQEIDYALSPHFVSGLHLAKILSSAGGFKELKILREQHLKIIKE